MNLLVFGASGSAGHELVRQSLEQGHVVTAFVRNPAKLTVKHQNLKAFQGDVKDIVPVERAVTGQGAVLCALGVSRPLKRDPVVVEGIAISSRQWRRPAYDASCICRSSVSEKAERMRGS